MAVTQKPSLLSHNELSPNQLAKRASIVRAASKLIVRNGVGACTARAVSTASNVSTSALHYYFQDIDEICDLAFRVVLDNFLQSIEDAANAEADPIDALWAGARMYLSIASGTDDEAGAHYNLRAPLLWFEYQSASLRSGKLDTVRELSSRGSNFLSGLVVRAKVRNAKLKGDLLHWSLLGASVADTLFHKAPHEILTSIGTGIGLPLSEKFCSPPKPARRKRVAND